MTEAEFIQLFRDALDVAAKNAECKLGRAVPRVFEVLLFGAGYSGVKMFPEEAGRVLFLGQDRFYRIIDVSVVGVEVDRCRVFVRVSGHSPGSFDETWNDPPGSGPFKQLLAQDIEVG